MRVCRELDYGVTGNFIVDPDWEEEDFRRLWHFKERLGLYRAGYTILTPLPGTLYFEEAKHRIGETFPLLGETAAQRRSLKSWLWQFVS